MIKLSGNNIGEKAFLEGKNLIKKGKLKKARKLFEFSLIHKLPLSKVLLYLGIVDFYNLNIADALKNFQNVIGSGSSNSVGDVYFYLGKIFKLINNEKEAFENFKKAIIFSESETNKLLAFEEIEDKLDNQEKEFFLKKARKFYLVRTTIPEDEEILLRSIDLRIEREYDKAIDILSRLTKVYPDFFQGYIELAKTYEIVKKPHLSYKVLKEFKKRFDEILISTYMPKITFKLRKYKESLYYNINFLLKKMPENYKIYLNIGTSYALLGNDNKALNFFKKAIDYNPSIFYPYYNIGCIYQKNGLIEEALEYYKAAYNIDPNNPMLNFNIGLIHFEKGEYFESLYYFNKAYENDNKFLDAKINFESVRIIKTVENNFSPDLEFSLPYKMAIGLSVFMIVLSFIYIIKWL